MPGQNGQAYPATPARLAAALGGRLPPPGARIGLLGGSFNPAHGGHLDLSRQALKRLRLDRVWWLVSPQNPLKPAQGMGSLQGRLARARAVACDYRIQATDIERVLGTRYTVDTVAALQARFPRVHFLWLMGADNLIELPRWSRWQSILNNIPVAIFDRPSYSLRAMASKPAKRFARNRLRERRAGRLTQMGPPAWVFVHMPLNPVSATRIRAQASS